MKNSKVDMLKAVLGSIGGKLFSVDFTKKDGTERHMVCRSKVHKNLTGTKQETTAKRKATLDSKGMVTVYEFASDSYKVLTLENVSHIKCGDIDIYMK